MGHVVALYRETFRFKMKACRAASSLFFLLVLPVSLGLVGCRDESSYAVGPETEDPSFQRAKDLLERNLNNDALSNFSKVVARRDGAAPESHLEIGLIYLNHLDDAVSAIYHFKRYEAISLRSGDSQSLGRSRSLIKTAQKEMLDKFPGDTYRDRLERIQLLESIKELKAEVEWLKSRNEQLAEALASAQAGKPPAVAAMDQASETQPPVSAGATESPPTYTQTTSRPTIETGERRHTVRPGDTLFSISRRFYGDSSRWREIEAANESTLGGSSNLRPGMVLKIP